MHSLQLYEEVCDDVGCSDIGCGHNASDFAPMVLLMPKEFEIIDYDDMEKYVELINVARLRADDNIGALTFGAQTPEYNNSGLRLAFPTAPTWQVINAELHLLQPILIDTLMPGRLDEASDKHGYEAITVSWQIMSIPMPVCIWH